MRRAVSLEWRARRRCLCCVPVNRWTSIVCVLGVLVPSVVRAQADAGVADAGVADTGTADAGVASAETAAREEVGREEAADASAASAREQEEEAARAEEEQEDDDDPDAHLSTAVFPDTHVVEPETDIDPEEEELERPPPPEPEWRLRLGVGATAGTAGSAQLGLRLIQEVEWMPHDAAPVLFAITGGQYVGDVIVGLAGARVGLYGTFCQDRIVMCTGAVALRAGVITGGYGTNVDIGGDADGRFRFDGVELTVRLGFWVIQGVTFVDLVGMVGAAF